MHEKDYIKKIHISKISHNQNNLRQSKATVLHLSNMVIMYADWAKKYVAQAQFHTHCHRIIHFLP